MKKTTRLSSLAALLLAAPALCACGSEASLPIENLGNTSGKLGGPASPPEQHAAVGKARLSGRWTGQTYEPVSDLGGQPSPYKFPSGSRNVTLDLTFDEDAFISGNVVFGAGTPPAPEAGVSYPPNVEHGFSVGPEFPPIEGFAYALGSTTLKFDTGADEDVILSYDRYAAFHDWCATQPSFPTAGGYECVDGGGTSGGAFIDGEGYVCLTDGTGERVDCDLGILCGGLGPCTCDSAGCSQYSDMGTVSLSLEGDELTAGFGDTMVDVGLPERELEYLGVVPMSRVKP